MIIKYLRIEYLYIENNIWWGKVNFCKTIFFFFNWIDDDEINTIVITSAK